MCLTEVIGLDPLEVMLNLKQVIPYYQPVISADTQLIVGYEVLPLFKEENGNLKQLDWFLMTVQSLEISTLN